MKHLRQAVGQTPGKNGHNLGTFLYFYVAACHCDIDSGPRLEISLFYDEIHRFRAQGLGHALGAGEQISIPANAYCAVHKQLQRE
jgi:hypothetical protein